MLNAISRINIELLHKTLRKKIPVIQNDTGRKLECTVTDCKLTSEIKARIWAMKPSGKMVYNNCNIKGNVVTIDLTNQLLAEQGLVACQLEFIEAESSVSSYEFVLEVERDLSGFGPESENESTVLDEYFLKIQKVIKDTEKAINNANEAAAYAIKGGNYAKTQGDDAKAKTSEAVTAVQATIQKITEEFKNIKDILDSTENGKLLLEIQQLLKDLYHVATDVDIDRIIEGTYVDEDEQGSIFETGTKEDIDAIIGGTYTENEEEMDATEQEIQDIIDQLFKEVRKK